MGRINAHHSRNTEIDARRWAILVDTAANSHTYRDEYKPGTHESVCAYAIDSTVRQLLDAVVKAANEEARGTKYPTATRRAWDLFRIATSRS